MTTFRILFIGINVATILLYFHDKRMSRSGGRRIPENYLHILAIIGGTPGAFIGQVLFHHKTRNKRFRSIFWMIAIMQVLILTMVWWGNE